MSGEKSLWIRLGTTLKLTDAEAEAILFGDAEVLKQVVQEGRFVLDGNAYVPNTVVEEFDLKYGGNHTSAWYKDERRYEDVDFTF